MNESLTCCCVTKRFCYCSYESLVALLIEVRPGSFCLASLRLDQRAGQLGVGSPRRTDSDLGLAFHWLSAGVRRVPGPCLSSSGDLQALLRRRDWSLIPLVSQSFHPSKSRASPDSMGKQKPARQGRRGKVTLQRV